MGTTPGAGGGASAVTSWDIAKITNYNNVMSFGAVGNGVADDTIAIQAAINNTTTNTVFLPKGTYKISSALVIRENLRVIGDGRESTVIKQVTSSENAFEMPFGQTKVTYYQDFTVEGTGSTVSSGAAFYMQSATPDTWSNSHHWTRIDIKHFGVGYHCYWIPLAAWRDCRVLNTGKGWYMDRVDTPMWINCATGGLANSMSVGIDVVNGGFSGQIIGGEWAATQRVFSFRGAARYTIIGGNIETNTKDGVIYVGQWASISIRQMRISLPKPESLKNAVILVDASDSNGTPRIEIGDMLMDLHEDWQALVIRGTYFYNVKPVVNMTEGARFNYQYGSQTTIMDVRSPTLAQWPQLLWQNAYPNTESNNDLRRGDIAVLNVNNGSLGKWEQPVMFYRTRQGTHKRGSLSNDRLMQVLYSQSDETKSLNSGESDLLNYEIPAYKMYLTGEAVTLEASGTFGENNNGKSLRIYLGANKIFDSLNQVANGKTWVLKLKIVRRNSYRVICTTTLLIDGMLPIVKSLPASNAGNTNSHQLRLVGMGSLSGDVNCDIADIVWRKSSFNE